MYSDGPIMHLSLPKSLWDLIRSCIPAVLLCLAAEAGGAQSPPPTAGQQYPLPPTPLEWKWQRLDADTTFKFAAQMNRPLVLLFPDAPGVGFSGIDDRLARYFFDEGYAVGVVDWRGDFGRSAAPSAIVARAFKDMSAIRSVSSGRFDASRLVMFGRGESSFLTMLLSDDAKRLASEGIPPQSICATVLISPIDLDPADRGSFDARRQFDRESNSRAMFSPLQFASSAPPTLIMSQLLDRADEARGNVVVDSLRAAGKLVVRSTYPQFEERDERTYFGASDNEATGVLTKFLRQFCPAKKAARPANSQQGQSTGAAFEK